MSAGSAPGKVKRSRGLWSGSSFLMCRALLKSIIRPPDYTSGDDLFYPILSLSYNQYVTACVSFGKGNGSSKLIFRIFETFIQAIKEPLHK